MAKKAAPKSKGTMMMDSDMGMMGKGKHLMPNMPPKSMPPKNMPMKGGKKGKC